VERSFRLRLLHFNDLHGRLADVSVDGIAPVFSRIAGFIRGARAEVAGRRDAGLLVLSGGDDLVGSPFAELAGTWTEQFRCHPAYRLYSAAGVDAVAVGNHDLDWGLEMLLLAAERDAWFPLLSANLEPGPRVHSPGIKPWTVVNVNGLRVGIIGLTSQSEIKRLFPNEFQIRDPLAAILELLPAVRAQSDVVVLLSHLGHRQEDPYPPPRGIRDVELALALPHGAVPAIVGSHTHTVLNEAGLDAGNVVNGILVAQAGSNGRYLGDMAVEVTPRGAQVLDARLWPLELLPEDGLFEQAHVLPLAQQVQRLLAEPVGHVAPHEDLDGTLVRERFAAGELALANFVTDALAARCRAAGLPVDFFMLDSPGLPAGLPQANGLTFADLFRLAPHADSVVLLPLPARALQLFLDDNARRVDLPGEPHEERGFVQFSRDLRYGIIGASSRGREALRAVDVHIGGMAAAELGERELVVGCTSFFREFSLPWEQRAAQQGSRMFAVRSLPCKVTRLAVRDELVAFVRGNGGVTESTGLVRDGRVVFDSR
jgi:5'-nucleotidase / UDP-sugar diphosphatase